MFLRSFDVFWYVYSASRRRRTSSCLRFIVVFHVQFTKVFDIIAGRLRKSTKKNLFQCNWNFMHPTGTVPDLYVPTLFNSRMDSDGSSDFITPSLQRDCSLTPWPLQKGVFITFIRKLMVRITVKLFWLLYSRMIGNYFPISSFNH